MCPSIKTPRCLRLENGVINRFNLSQIWFHNVPFRQALYDWDPEEDEAERENDTLLMAER